MRTAGRSTLLIFTITATKCRVAMAHGLNYYEVPTHWSTLDVYYDLNSRRYPAIGLDNEEDMYDFSQSFNDNEFTQGALRREGRR